MKEVTGVPGDENLSTEKTTANNIGETVGYLPFENDSDLKSSKPLPAIIVDIEDDGTLILQVFNNRTNGSLLRKAKVVVVEPKIGE